MLDAAKRTGKKLTIGYQGRQTSQAQYLKNEALKGTFGDIYYAVAHAIRRRGVPTWGVFLNEYEQGGGPLIDIGTHSLDMALWVMDNYKPKYAVGTTYHKLNDQTNTANPWGDWDPAKFTVEDSAFGFVVMENGATIRVDSSWALNMIDEGYSYCTIAGTKAGADIKNMTLRINGVRDGRQYLTKYDFSSGGVAFFDGDANEEDYVKEARQWIHAVVNDTDPCVLPEQALCVTRILEAIYTSAKTGDIVFLNK